MGTAPPPAPGTVASRSAHRVHRSAAEPARAFADRDARACREIRFVQKE
jgi:hypothetical protein